MHAGSARHWVIKLFLAAALLSVGTARAEATKTIFFNGQVFTADPRSPWAHAVAVEGDRIVAVGTDGEVLRLADANTRLYDLGGRTLVPGLNDAHVHVAVPQGVYLNAPDFIPGPGPALADVLGILRAGAQAKPPGTWLFLFVGEAISEDPRVDRFALDAVTSAHPVALFSWTGHGIWINTSAMKALGLSETQPDPLGGRYDRQPDTGVINGVAHEGAEWELRRRMLALLSDEALVAQYRNFAAQAVRYGYTSLQDIPVSIPRDRALRILQTAALPLRVRSICLPLSLDESCDAPPPRALGERITASGIKRITDGTPIERLAFVDRPYADRPDWHGVLNFDPGTLNHMLASGLRGNPRRDQLLFHGVGDGAIEGIIAGMEATGGAGAWQGRRTRIEHGDLLFPENFERIRQLGVVIVQNPTHLALTSVFAQRFSPAVFARVQPLASLLRAGIPLALGTDGIGVPLSPFVDLFLARIHPTRPSEALTVEQGVSAYTRGSAFAEFEEHRKGTLAPGMLADLAILSQDIFHVPAQQLPATTSVLTMVGGAVVWSTGALHPVAAAR